jgi:hypothetical protein
VIELRTADALYLIKINPESRAEIEEFLDQEMQLRWVTIWKKVVVSMPMIPAATATTMDGEDEAEDDGDDEDDDPADDDGGADDDED